MVLREYLRILRKSWILILVLTALGLAAGIGYSLAKTKLYQASTQIFVATAPGQSISQLAQANTFVLDQVQSYTSIATSPAVTGPVVKQLGLHMSSSDLAGKIQANAPTSTVLINLTVTDGNPHTAAKLAKAVSAQFDRVVERTAQGGVKGKPVVRLSVIHPATVPSAPVAPNTNLNIALGIVVGLLVGLLAAIVRDTLDNTADGAHHEQ